MTNPHDPNLTFSVDVHPRDGETFYSIHAAFYKDTNITELVSQYSPHLFQDWEQQLHYHA